MKLKIEVLGLAVLMVTGSALLRAHDDAATGGAAAAHGHADAFAPGYYRELRGEYSADGGRWWRGNTHTHSWWSDGDSPPEVVAAWYR